MRFLLLLSVSCTWLLVGGLAANDKAAVVLETPGLVAFWDFQEEAGSPRLSRGGGQVYALKEQGGTVERAEGGVFGPYAARIARGQWLMVPRQELGELDIHGKEARVTVIAWIKRRDRQAWQALAGIWDETHKKRQYCLFLYGTTATRADEMKRYPVRDRIHGHVSAVGGPTAGEKYCITYATGATEIGFDAWHCVAMTYDGASSRVYVDGKLDAWEHRNPFPYTEGLFEGGEDGADFTVGAVHRGGEWGNFFGGDMGGVAVYRRALGEAELRTIARGTLRR
ncbi:MAG: LamG domain-containing protein [Verrucomicrobiaceae bacterium]|nr:LamG domain-containing protein [Verrucomicrobiaceae bacterium]